MARKRKRTKKRNSKAKLSLAQAGIEKRVFNEAETAEYLGVSRSTLRKGRMQKFPEKGEATPPYVKFGKSIRYLVADLNTWLNARRVIQD